MLLDWEARKLARVLDVLLACDLVGEVGQIEAQKLCDDTATDFSGLHCFACFQVLHEESRGQEKEWILQVRSAIRSIWSCAQIYNAMGAFPQRAEDSVRHWP